MDDFAVAAARQIEAPREHIARVGTAVPRIAIVLRPARIIAVTVVGALASLMPLIVAIAAVVMLLAGRVAPSAGRQYVVVVIAVAFVPIARVA